MIDVTLNGVKGLMYLKGMIFCKVYSELSNEILRSAQNDKRRAQNYR